MGSGDAGHVAAQSEGLLQGAPDPPSVELSVALQVKLAGARCALELSDEIAEAVAPVSTGPSCCTVEKLTARLACPLVDRVGEVLLRRSFVSTPIRGSTRRIRLSINRPGVIPFTAGLVLGRSLLIWRRSRRSCSMTVGLFVHKMLLCGKKLAYICASHQ